jgi:hypothetical protein
LIIQLHTAAPPQVSNNQSGAGVHEANSADKLKNGIVTTTCGMNWVVNTQINMHCCRRSGSAKTHRPPLALSASSISTVASAMVLLLSNNGRTQAALENRNKFCNVGGRTRCAEHIAALLEGSERHPNDRRHDEK